MVDIVSRDEFAVMRKFADMGDGSHAEVVQQAGILAIPHYDYIGLSYTGSDMTGVVYKTGGASGTTVATLALTYSGGKLVSVSKT